MTFTTKLLGVVLFVLLLSFTLAELPTYRFIGKLKGASMAGGVFYENPGLNDCTSEAGFFSEHASIPINITQAPVTYWVRGIFTLSLTNRMVSVRVVEIPDWNNTCNGSFGAPALANKGPSLQFAFTFTKNATYHVIVQADRFWNHADDGRFAVHLVPALGHFDLALPSPRQFQLPNPEVYPPNCATLNIVYAMYYTYTVWRADTSGQMDFEALVERPTGSIGIAVFSSTSTTRITAFDSPSGTVPGCSVVGGDVVFAGSQWNNGYGRGVANWFTYDSPQGQRLAGIANIAVTAGTYYHILIGTNSTTARVSALVEPTRVLSTVTPNWNSPSLGSTNASCTTSGGYSRAWAAKQWERTPGDADWYLISTSQVEDNIAWIYEGKNEASPPIACPSGPDRTALLFAKVSSDFAVFSNVVLGQFYTFVIGYSGYSSGSTVLLNIMGGIEVDIPQAPIAPVSPPVAVPIAPPVTAPIQAPTSSPVASPKTVPTPVPYYYDPYYNGAFYPAPLFDSAAFWSNPSLVGAAVGGIVAILVLILAILLVAIFRKRIARCGQSDAHSRPSTAATPAPTKEPEPEQEDTRYMAPPAETVAAGAIVAPVAQVVVQPVQPKPAPVVHQRPCFHCDGRNIHNHNAANSGRCSFCHGSGHSYVGRMQTNCIHCSSTGNCRFCNGTGWQTYTDGECCTIL